MPSGFIDGVGQLGGVGATDDDAISAGQEELLDELGLFLRVLFIGRAPVNFDFEAVLGAQVTRSIVRSDACRFEKGIALGLGNHAEGVAFLTADE